MSSDEETRREHQAEVVGRVVREDGDEGSAPRGRVIPDEPEPEAERVGRVIHEDPDRGAPARGRVLREGPEHAA